MKKKNFLRNSFILGIILGNLDPEFRDLFANGVGLLIQIIGWKIVH